MSNQVLGPERCLMMSPNKAGQFVKGSAYIDAKLAQGWTIVESERNHLLPGRVKGAETGSQAKVESTACAKEPFEHEPVEVPKQIGHQETRKRRRRNGR